MTPDYQLAGTADAETGFFVCSCPRLQQMVLTTHLTRMARSPEVAQIPPTPAQTLTRNCQKGSLKY